MFKPVFKLTTDLKRWSEKKKKEWRKAMSLALSKSSYELMSAAKQDLKTGKLGLRRLSYMTDQSDPRFKKKRYRKNVRARRMMERASLTGLFRGITYKVDRNRLVSEVGFRGVGGTAWQRRIAERSLHHYQWRYTDEMRASLHKIGIHLRKTTTFGQVPARDVMGAVQDKYEKKTFQRINLLFLKRIAGERI